MQLKKLQDAAVEGRRVLVRCGFDVPFDADGNISEDIRIRECLPTLQWLLERKATLILASHNGRPKGQIVLKLSMGKVAERLEKLLGVPVRQLHDCVGVEVATAVSATKPGSVVLLENLRFHAGEEANSPDFAKQLASYADVYVNEAFANSHRDHASMTGVPKLIPGYAGLRLQEEVAALGGVLENPGRPLVAIIGGAKISDKIRVIRRFLDIADHVLIGGALANTILKAQGVSIGKSLVEEDMMAVARELPLTSTKLHVPVDVIIAHQIDKGAVTQTKAVGTVGDDEYILDIGPDTVKLYGMVIAEAKMVVWGGPMGYYELPQFAAGTRSIAAAVGKSGARSVVGGGDTVDALNQAGYEDKVSFVSTGGGAMLKFLEGKSLPALLPLMIP
ncbi:MAG: phosphoglycerate kinase [Patescibacteria group bacterium]